MSRKLQWETMNIGLPSLLPPMSKDRRGSSEYLHAAQAHAVTSVFRHGGEAEPKIKLSAQSGKLGIGNYTEEYGQDHLPQPSGVVL